jgi:hypothetical protein
MTEHGVVFRSFSAVLPNSSRQIPVSGRAPVITTSIPSDTTKAVMILSAAPRFNSIRQPVRLGNPGQDERDSGMMPNGVPGCSRTGFRDEGEHRFRDEADQFQAEPGTAFGFAGMISTGV